MMFVSLLVIFLNFSFFERLFSLKFVNISNFYGMWHIHIPYVLYMYTMTLSYMIIYTSNHFQTVNLYIYIVVGPDFVFLADIRPDYPALLAGYRILGWIIRHCRIFALNVYHIWNVLYMYSVYHTLTYMIPLYKSSHFQTVNLYIYI